MKNNTNEIYHSDHLGSSSYITDNFGRPSHYYEYLPFGELLTEHNQSKYYIDPYPTQNMSEYNNPYKFNGKEMDRETGMYYYGARYYDPRISIFVSVDPLAEQTMEPYLYTGNNPIMFTDPTGMSKEGGEDWVYNKKDKTYHWDSKVNKPSDITNSNYEYVGKSTDDVKDHYDDNNWFGNPKFGDDLNAPWQGELKQHIPDFWDRQSEGNIAQKVFYDFSNGFYTTGQMFLGRSVGDSSMRNLDGSSTTTDQGVLGFVGVGTMALGGNTLKMAAGPTKQWIRSGPSYSHNLASKTSYSIRWGASPGNKGKYLKQIPSDKMRQLNQWTRNQKLPGNSWRVKDPGHFHIKK